MIRSIAIVGTAAILAGFGVVVAQESTAGNAIAGASQALGAERLNSVRVTARGANFAFAQSYAPDAPWPRFVITGYTAQIDYRTPTMRVELERTVDPDGPVPAGVVRAPGMWRGGGGAPPLIGTQRQVQTVSGSVAWDGEGAAVRPALAASNARLLEIWLTPHGVIKAAQVAGNNPRVTVEGGRTVIRYTAAGTMVTATLNGERLVDRVSTMGDNPVLGDVQTETVYSAYRDFGGIKFPTRIVRSQGGFPVLDLTITDVLPNAAVTAEVPDTVKTAAAQPPAAPAPPKLEAVKLGEGVYRIVGGSHQSVAVEFTDHVAVIEGGLGDALALPTIDTIKRTIPNKPIRYVINSHHHFDHSGGLRAFVAEGATVVTHAINRPFYEQAWARPRTIRPDRLAQAPRQPRFETVTDRKVLTDGAQTIELHHMEGVWHNAGLIVAYLPKEKLLVEPDLYEPGVPSMNAPPGALNADFANLVRNIERLRLDVDRIAPLHTPMSTLNDLKAAIAKGQAAR